MDIETQRVTLTDCIIDLFEVLLMIEYYQGVVVIVMLIRRMHQRVFEHNDRCVLIRCRELEGIRRVIGSGQIVCDLHMCPFANLQRINHTVNRMNSEVQVVVRLTEVMRRIHGRIVADRVVNACGSKDTIVEDIGLTLADMLVEMVVNRIRNVEGPDGNTIARVRTFIMYISVSTHVLKRTEGRYRIVDHRITLDPNRVVGPERLYRITLTDRILYRRQRFGLVRTNDDMVEIAMVAIPYDGVVIIIHTMPFVLPYIIPFTAVLIHECRMYGITQGNKVSFADKGRIVLC